MAIKDLHLIITGGTIDSGLDYDPDKKCVYPPNAKSRIKPYIEKFIKPDFEIFETVICMLDSGDITDKHRQEIYNAVATSKSQNIIITHGTDTMTQTGKWLFERLGTSNTKKVVLVGAFKPLSFAETDAPFNLGFAIGQIEHLPPNVYIAMNSEIYDVNHVKKDKARQRFVTLSH